MEKSRGVVNKELRRNGFDPIFWLFLAFVITGALLFVAYSARINLLASSSQENRETVLDRVVHIERELITDIPSVRRWCDRLNLKKRRINVGDCKLYVEEEGKGAALVLINGGPGGTHHYFHPWFSRAAKFARVIYYDQRGCGLSDFKPGQGYTVDQAVSDLEMLRRALDCGKWVLLGFSYGGFLAQYYTIKYPENTAGLVLLSASPGVLSGSPPPGQCDFISNEEKNRMREIPREVKKWAQENGISEERSEEILLYNLVLNGDWKYQHFYKPSSERMAQMALYEWKCDKNFNQTLNSSEQRIDLVGAFALCPIPTLILEGKYDFGRSPDKPTILLQNHPGAKMVVFERASHCIYEEEPDKFFEIVQRFIHDLPTVTEPAVLAYRNDLIQREKEQKSAPDLSLEVFGWGRSSNEKMAKLYSREWLAKFREPQSFLKVGFALYDTENYAEALFAFERMQDVAQKQPNIASEAMALIWQGHMLDLLGKRDEAVKRYQKAVDMNIKGLYQHDQFGIHYSLSPYAAERLKEPFKRIENRFKD